MTGRGKWFVLAFAVAFTLRASAQSVAVAQLSGIVADETSGALPGVTVT